MPLLSSVPPWAPVLLEKYEEMLRMRRADLDGSTADPRGDMVALARRFPGALREIDEMPLGELEGRVAALRGLVCGEPMAAALPWGPLSHRYHALLRGALAAKRWLGRRRELAAGDRERFARATRAMAHPDDALEWAGLLEAVARPPTGRITDLVLKRLGEEFAQTIEQVQGELFAFGRRRASKG